MVRKTPVRFTPVTSSPVTKRPLLEVAARPGDAGVGERDVGGPELVVDPAERLLQLVLVRYVGPHDERPSSQPGHGRSGGRRPLRVDVDARDVRAGLRAGDGAGATDAAGRARHDDDAPVEAKRAEEVVISLGRLHRSKS
jgi:hypothetical protein